MLTCVNLVFMIGNIAFFQDPVQGQEEALQEVLISSPSVYVYSRSAANWHAAFDGEGVERNALVWRVPAGRSAHSGLVEAGTLLAGLAGVAVIIAAALDFALFVKWGPGIAHRGSRPRKRE